MCSDSGPVIQDMDPVVHLFTQTLVCVHGMVSCQYRRFIIGNYSHERSTVIRMNHIFTVSSETISWCPRLGTTSGHLRRWKGEFEPMTAEDPGSTPGYEQNHLYLAPWTTALELFQRIWRLHDAEWSLISNYRRRSGTDDLPSFGRHQHMWMSVFSYFNNFDCSELFDKIFISVGLFDHFINIECW